MYAQRKRVTVQLHVMSKAPRCVGSWTNCAWQRTPLLVSGIVDLNNVWFNSEAVELAGCLSLEKLRATELATESERTALIVADSVLVIVTVIRLVGIEFRLACGAVPGTLEG